MTVLDVEALKSKIERTITMNELSLDIFHDNTCPICYDEYQSG